MGAPRKWIKALLGPKRFGEQQSLVKDTNCFGCTRKIWHQRKHSDEVDSAICENELNQNVIPEIEDAEVSNLQSITNSTSLPSAAKVKQNTVEELAAIQIQAAFRGFLARRALRALKGLVKLQAIVRGRAVRKQAAITLHCMQAVVRLQARARARRANIALENQTTQENLQHQQRYHKAHVKQIEDGWCDTVGSVEEIQAKLLKRKEAAAKREKALSYASARQWQANSRQKVKPVGIEPDNSYYRKDLSQNRLLDVNLEDRMRRCETEPAASQCMPATGLISTGRKPKPKPKPDVVNGKMVRNSSNSLDVSNVKRAASPSKVRNPSPNKSANANGTPNAIGSSRSSKSALRGSGEEARSRPNIGSRSQSTPKERTAPAREQEKQRLSLQDSRQGFGAKPSRQLGQTTVSVKRSPAPKPGRPKPK